MSAEALGALIEPEVPERPIPDRPRHGWLRTRAAALVAVGAGVLAVGAVEGVVAIRPTTHGSLALAGGGYNFCYAAPDPAAWAVQSRVGYILGLDALTLSSDSARVTVTSVGMTKPTGGMSVLDVAFVPSAEVGGARGDEGIKTTTPVLASLARRIPASLTVTPPPAGDPIFNPRVWQLVVTVRAPLGSTRATTGPFEITYRTGSVTRTLTARDSVTLGTTACGK